MGTQSSCGGAAFPAVISWVFILVEVPQMFFRLMDMFPAWVKKRASITRQLALLCDGSSEPTGLCRYQG